MTREKSQEHGSVRTMSVEDALKLARAVAERAAYRAELQLFPKEMSK